MTAHYRNISTVLLSVVMGIDESPTSNTCKTAKVENKILMFSMFCIGAWLTAVAISVEI